MNKRTHIESPEMRTIILNLLAEITCCQQTMQAVADNSENAEDSRAMCRGRIQLAQYTINQFHEKYKL